MSRTAGEALTETQLLDRLRALTPLIEARAADAERARKPDDEVMRAIEDTGVYRFFVPRRFGGCEFSVPAFVEIGQLLGQACVSTAWVTTFCMEHNWLLALFDAPAQEDIFGQHPYIIAPGSLAPNGQARRVEGGYRVTGRWQWGTGVMHANWVLVGAIVADADSTAAGRPDLGMFALPIDAVDVIDTWQVDGMAATGSNDIAISDVFVPAQRKVSIGLLADGRSPGARWHGNPLYKMPMLPFLGLTAAAPAVGGARRAVNLFGERIRSRSRFGSASAQGESATTHLRFGHLSARIEATESQLQSLAAEIEAWGHRPPCPTVQRASLRLRLAHVVRAARDVVRDVLEASGASAHRLDNPLQRIHRDLHTPAGHTVFDLDVGAALYGRVLLGLDANAPV